MLREPYERLPEESDKAWQAFVVYRDMAPVREFVRVAKQQGCSVKTVHQWSSLYTWRRRVAAWDDELDRQRRKAEIEAVREMKKRHIKLALKMQNIAENELEKLAEKSENSLENTLEPKMVKNYLMDGTTLERLNRGQPTEIVENPKPEYDFTSLSRAELRALRDMKRKLEDE